MRGESVIRGDVIQIAIGEIKSGKDRGKALVQLLKRLCIVGYIWCFLGFAWRNIYSVGVGSIFGRRGAKGLS